MMRSPLTVVALAAMALLAACTTTNPDVVQRHEAQRLSTVQDATILTIRPVVVDGTQTGAGAMTGGVVGGIAGSSVGGYREGAVVGVIGALLITVMSIAAYLFDARSLMYLALPGAIASLLLAFDAFRPRSAILRGIDPPVPSAPPVQR